MLNISRLYSNVQTLGDHLRYGRKKTSEKKPIVVWNITNRCNLSCQHCYASANCDKSVEFTTNEVKNIINDLASFKVPVLLFSGGEPMLRPDIIDLVKYTTDLGVRAVLSTNGMLITDNVAEKLKDAKITYVGISLDGTKEKHNFFRGDNTAFDKTMAGIKSCKKYGIKVGLRFTIHKKNYKDIPYIFDLMEKEDIPRICFYHLVPSGRGEEIKEFELSVEEKRDTMDLLIDKTKEFEDRGIKKEILTVDNHCDAIYLYQRMARENHPLADEAWKLINNNKSDSSGIGISSISWDGTVYPDQFWRNKPLGNLKESTFEEVWTNSNNDFLAKLRNKREYISGRCSQCKYLDICGGNFRARAEAMTGEPWASDPGCYLFDEEITN